MKITKRSYRSWISNPKEGVTIPFVIPAGTPYISLGSRPGHWEGYIEVVFAPETFNSFFPDANRTDSRQIVCKVLMPDTYVDVPLKKKSNAGPKVSPSKGSDAKVKRGMQICLGPPRSRRLQGLTNIEAVLDGPASGGKG